jgi:hypothetical protein
VVVVVAAAIAQPTLTVREILVDQELLSLDM